MHYVFKSIFIIAIVIQMVMGSTISMLEVAGLLTITSLTIFREKYYGGLFITLLEFLVVTALVYVNPDFAVLAGIIVYDFMRIRFYWGLTPVFITGIFFLQSSHLIEFVLLTAVCSFTGYISQKLYYKDKLYKKLYDRERQYRYELEDMKSKLINSSKEAIHIAQVKERNRIAMDIHDNAGHSLAAIHIQLQAAYKLYGKDTEKSMSLVKDSIQGISSTLSIIRDTVHNLKPMEKPGIEYIKNIINSFKFCPVEFSFGGNFDILPAGHIEFISSSIKEALTNTSRYSKASMVYINLDINENFVRLYLKDNGTGSENIIEGLGLTGMRERVKNMGGNLSISSDNGFLIVCILPIDQDRGGKIFEGSDSR